MIYGEITVFGTPGETRTHYLTLRRRTLYPGELRGHNLRRVLYRKKVALSMKMRHIFPGRVHIVLGKPRGGGNKMERNHEQEVDLDDLIFDEDDGYPSER